MTDNTPEKESLIARLERIKADMAIDLDAATPQNRVAQELRKRRAEEDFVRTQIELSALLKASVALIILRGPEDLQKKFADLAKEIGGTLTIDTRKAYSDMTSGVLVASGNTGIIDVDGLVAIQRRVNGYKEQVRLKNLMVPNFGTLLHKKWEKESDFVDAVRAEIRACNGDSVNDVALRRSITDQVIASKQEGPVIPTVVLNAIDAEIPWLSERFFGTRALVVEVANEVTETDVINAFNQLKNKLQGN